MRFQNRRTHTIPGAEADIKSKIRFLAIFALFALPAILLLYALTAAGLFDVQKSVSLCFTGDILLDRGVAKAIGQNGADYPYMSVKNLLKRADIAVGNLECPLTGKGIPSLKDKKYIFRAETGNSRSLKAAGFDLLNLANNHAMDYGSEGLVETMEALARQGILTAGAGTDAASAFKPTMFETNGFKICFLSFCAFPAEGYFYFEDRPDITLLDEQKFADSIRDAKAASDVLILSVHWGNEFSYYPGEKNMQLARTAIDCGADAVIGHHPHVLQGVEKYKAKFVFYSLGNFVFDKQVPEGTDETVILEMKVTKHGISNVSVTPVTITDCRPQIATGANAAHILDRLVLYSKGMGAVIENYNGIGKIR